MNVDLCRIETQFADDRERLRRERLVELEEIDAVGRQPGAIQRQPDGRHGPHPHDERIDTG